MEAVRDRYTVWGTPVYQNANTAEKGAATPLLADHRATYPTPVEAPRPRRSCARKVFLHLIHFSIIAAVFYFLVPRFLPGGKFHHPATGDMADWGYGHDSPSPQECVDHADWTYEHQVPPRYRQFRHYAHTSFDLPRYSSSLYFIARGVLSHGSIEIVNDGTDSQNVKVDVALLYNLEDVFDRVDVCTLQRGEDKNGVGIFSPRHQHPPHHQDRTQFIVTVHLPAGEGLQFYEELETDMPLFVHAVGDLGTDVFFETISLKTSNDPINIKSLSAEHATLTTSNSVIRGAVNATVIKAHSSNGPIEGVFESVYDISLVTNNSPVKVKLTLSNDDVSNPSKLLLTSSNAPIESEITLVSKSEDHTGGAFDVKTSTSNSHVNVVFPSAPVDSKLDLIAHSSNGPVWAKLHPTFDGSFSAYTSSFAQPTLQYDRNTEDPAGRDRQRDVTVHRQGRGVIEGEVHWSGGQVETSGKVQLQTSNAGIRLNI
ncbi:hypothetical protein QCA50_006834 [Cerrena zonata]|uniref:Adhesin domain-containing protein n=1 Tax=Cerrena zonata TaxID=2478898 RepID=A0AAW0GIW8_9APHY